MAIGLLGRKVGMTQIYDEESGVVGARNRHAGWALSRAAVA